MTLLNAKYEGHETVVMLLVDRIRRYTAEYDDINLAVEQAVTECIEENILADFLRKNRTEAIEVSIFEYDEKREKELIRKAEFAEGERVGLEKGERVGLEKGERIGLEKGEKIGMKEGMDRIFEINRLFASVDKGIQNKTTKYGLPTY